MVYRDYELIAIERDAGVLFATVDAPPINIVTLALFGELARLASEVAADPDVRVLVLKSADPDFFLAHFDVAAILSFPTEAEVTREGAAENAWHAMCERFSTMDAVTIAQIEGRVGGGGAEIAISFDMRFGVVGKTIVNQMEVPLGILPGGTGTQRLPRLVGRGRALEMILGGVDVDAGTAERWGWLNRAFAPEAIGDHVDRLARRIASLPPEALRLAKRSVGFSEPPMTEGLIEESLLFQALIRTPRARAAMTRFLAIGGQTRDGELRVAELSAEASG